MKAKVAILHRKNSTDSFLRSRFLKSEKMIKQKEEHLQSLGYETRRLDRKDWDEDLPERRYNSNPSQNNISNRWTFFAIKVDDEEELICIKNGSMTKLKNLP